jgi:hypothetical protein
MVDDQNYKFDRVKVQFDLAHEKTVRERSDIQTKLKSVNDSAVIMKEINNKQSLKVDAINKAVETLFVAEELKLALDQ